MPAFIPNSPRKAARNRVKATNYKAVCRQVDLRDRGLCRVCGFPGGHHHHIVFRSQGGTDTVGNLIVVCAWCHDDIHGRKVRVTGDAGGALTIVAGLTRGL